MDGKQQRKSDKSILILLNIHQRQIHPPFKIHLFYPLTLQCKTFKPIMKYNYLFLIFSWWEHSVQISVSLLRAQDSGNISY